MKHTQQYADKSVEALQALAQVFAREVRVLPHGAVRVEARRELAAVEAELRARGAL